MKDEENHRDIKELIFVYNVDSDFFSRVVDFAHKTVSPGTYACSLCRITHGPFTMHREWADFLQALPYKVSFQYKDQWKGPELAEGFPLVLLKEGKETKVLLTASQLDSVKSVQELIDLIVL